VEYTKLNDEIRFSRALIDQYATVDIDERLPSTVQVRFSRYVRKVFANVT